jgi:hypothetical protein
MSEPTLGPTGRWRYTSVPFEAEPRSIFRRRSFDVLAVEIEINAPIHRNPFSGTTRLTWRLARPHEARMIRAENEYRPEPTP